MMRQILEKTTLAVVDLASPNNSWPAVLVDIFDHKGAFVEMKEQRHPGLTAERQNIENIQDAKAWDKVLAPLMAVSVGFSYGHCGRAGPPL